MKIISRDGTVTYTKWWDQLRVELDGVFQENGGTEIVLATKPGPGHYEEHKLLLAEFPDNRAAIAALYEELNEGLEYKRPSFDISEWSYEAERAV